MAFSGPAPEVINGRLAMLAFVAAAGAELATGAPVAAQLKEAPLFIGLTFLIFSIASLVSTLNLNQLTLCMYQQYNWQVHELMCTILLWPKHVRHPGQSYIVLESLVFSLNLSMY